MQLFIYTEPNLKTYISFIKFVACGKNKFEIREQWYTVCKYLDTTHAAERGI